MFKFLWRSSHNELAINIPKYLNGEEEDSIDLQIRSLIYMFKRFKINKLSPFLKTDQIGKYEFDWIDSTYDYDDSIGIPDNGIINDKLDQVYDIELFRNKILNDPYRILIDYTKNKFRSLLILSDFPIEISKLPSFKVSNFQFLILKANSTDDEYIDILVNKSGIYAEHRVLTSIKIDILTKLLAMFRSANNDGVLTKNDRFKIIQQYVQTLAFHIQVDRIFKATMRSKVKQVNVLKSKKSISVLNQQQQQHTRTPLRSQKSRMNIMMAPAASSNESPTKSIGGQRTLKSKPSMSILKLDKVYNANSDSDSLTSENSTTLVDTKVDLDNFEQSNGASIYTSFTNEERTNMFEQSKLAVRVRVERERNYLNRYV
ncbi:hypothetical protein CANARDRAFT_7359 [[Candida] arabinofermentans NRRL YB-2248]|uniref:Uncharacterized protein n=1 Tax=[Candida] arabinofermentans NRRL YB-2248 TaxID=983967 RepID=A0A1E4T2N1_9ASCO|nr:hypothetical protein CANARDRAFT_7359 [[Candida] arabinofermentans NRRL YB-2248]